jgi:RimJ/RimL family protein N-acetyltransferase
VVVLGSEHSQPVTVEQRATRDVDGRPDRVGRCRRRTSEVVDVCVRLVVVVSLVRADLRLMDAALVGDDALSEALGHDVAAGWASFTGALKPTRDALAADPEGAVWGTRFFVDGDPPELVGWGGFKGPPQGGVVELGYEIAECRRGRGIATAAVRAMLAEAFADEAVSAVIAHTLPQRNASNRVLEKVGFAFDDETLEDGDVVWRFVLTRPAGT